MSIWTAENREEIYSGSINVPGFHFFGHTKFLEAAQPLPEHVHPGCMEFTIIAQGTQSYRVRGQSHTISKGESYVTFLDEPHQSGGLCQQPGDFYWFQLKPEEEEFLGLSPSGAASLRGTLLALRERILPADELCLMLAQQCHSALLRQENSLCAASLLVSLLTRMLFVEQPRPLADPVAQSAANYVQSHLKEPLSVAMVSQAIGVSLSTLQHRFVQSTGQTLKQYINAQKIEASKATLLQTRSVTYTAMEYGFSSSNYYAAVFKKQTRIPPRGFLNREV